MEASSIALSDSMGEPRLEILEPKHEGRLQSIPSDEPVTFEVMACRRQH